MNKSILNSNTSRNWLPYAAKKLRPEGTPGDIMESWLRETLQPLSLPDDLTGKIITSAQDSAARIPAGVDQVHLLVFTQVLPLHDHHTWGFFRTVKNRAMFDRLNGSMHEIAFYLYMENLVMPG